MKDAFFPERSMTGRFIASVVTMIAAYAIVFFLMAFMQESMGVSFDTSNRTAWLWAVSLIANLLLYMNFHAKCHVACEREHNRKVKEDKCREFARKAAPWIIGVFLITLGLAVVVMISGFIENVNVMNKGIMTMPSALVGFATNLLLINKKLGWPMSVVE